MRRVNLVALLGMLFAGAAVTHAATIDTAPFDTRRFREALQEIRNLTTQRPSFALNRLKALCADAGVAIQPFILNTLGVPVENTLFVVIPSAAQRSRAIPQRSP